MVLRKPEKKLATLDLSCNELQVKRAQIVAQAKTYTEAIESVNLKINLLVHR